jgi:hypothetical protein
MSEVVDFATKRKQAQCADPEMAALLRDLADSIDAGKKFGVAVLVSDGCLKARLLGDPTQQLALSALAMQLAARVDESVFGGDE